MIIKSYFTAVLLLCFLYTNHIVGQNQYNANQPNNFQHCSSSENNQQQCCAEPEDNTIFKAQKLAASAQNSLGYIQNNTNAALPASYNFKEYVFAEPEDQGNCTGATNLTATIAEIYTAQTHWHPIGHPLFFTIGHRPALLQVAVTGAGVAPDVQVEGFMNGNSLGILCLNGPAALSDNINLETPNFEDFFSVTLPKSWVKNGLDLTITTGNNSRTVLSEELKIGPYTEMNLVTVNLDILDYNTSSHNYPVFDDFLEELASAIPASVVRFGVFPETITFPTIVSSTGEEQLVVLNSKNELGSNGINDGWINAFGLKWLKNFHKSSHDYLSTVYFGNTLNLAPGGWGGGKGFVSFNYTRIFIHELGHALSLPHWGTAYLKENPNANQYNYPYGGIRNNGGGIGNAWSFVQDSYEFVSPVCETGTGDGLGLERSDCMQRPNACNELRASGEGPWDGYGDFSAIAIHQYLVGAAAQKGQVMYNDSLVNYHLKQHAGFPTMSLQNDVRVYTRDPIQPQALTTQEKIHIPESEALNTDAYLIYGSAHPTQAQANIVYKPIKFNGTIPEIIDPTNAITFSKLNEQPYATQLSGTKDITVKVTYVDGSILHAINPNNTYLRQTSITGRWRTDVCDFSLVIPADKAIGKVEVFDRKFCVKASTNTTEGNINYAPYNITAENFMEEATLLSAYCEAEFCNNNADKVKVFVLAGQSNMEGHGDITDAQNDPNSLIDVLQNDADGKWLALGTKNNWNVLDNAWLYFDKETEIIRANITVGQGKNANKIGPELMFANRLDAYYEEPVLIIKTAWGGKSLAVDFRPPSAGGTTGAYYNLMIETVKKVTQNLSTEFPQIGTSDFELSGFFWFQGWNDGGNANLYNEYESNLNHLVNDVRSSLNSPNLPFVIASSGQGGYETATGRAWTIALQEHVSVAQENVACNDMLYGGTVGFVDTKAYYLDADASPANSIHHFNNNALTMLNVGNAAGMEMIEAINDAAYCNTSCNETLVCEAEVNGSSSILENCALTLCEGETLSLSVYPNLNTIDWTGPNGFTAKQTNTINLNDISLNEAGKYTATLTQNGCSYTQTITLNIDALPTATVNVTNIDCTSTTGAFTFQFQDVAMKTDIEFSIDGGISYPYSYPDNSSSKTLSEVAAGNYSVWVRWADGVCPIYVGSYTVEVFSPETGKPCDDQNPCTETSIFSNCACEAVTNFALKGTTSMSSVYAKNLNMNAGNLNDGIISNDNNELTHTTDATNVEWIEIDLGEILPISTVVIWNRTNCCSGRLNNTNLIISNLPLPNSTNEIPSLTFLDYFYEINDADNKSSIGIDVNTSGRYVRIQKNGMDDTNEAINIKELQIFGTSTTILDADEDGVCDALDLCPGFDDNADENQNDVPDGCDCPETIVRNESLEMKGTYEAFESLTSSAKVNTASGGLVTYKADLDGINLKPGFEADGTVDFDAKIGVCGEK